MRKRLYEIIEVSKDNDTISHMYDVFMMVTIAVSLIPLFYKETTTMLNYIDKITVTVFIVDYVLRLSVSDYKLNHGKLSFVLYPFTFMAIIDLVSILPSLTTLSRGFKALKALRIGRTFRVFRVMKAFKAFRYSKNIDIIIRVLKRSKDSLLVVCFLAAGYLLVTSLIMFNVEPETFNSYFDALYWATISLTTVGYGDVYAVSNLGKVLTMLSSVFGIAIIALPSGIITAGYMNEINGKSEEEI